MTSIGTDVVGELKEQLSGQVLTVADPAYEGARTVFRGGFDGHPLAIARVTSAQDIAHVIRVAREAHLPLSVRSGGHSSSGASTNDGGLVVDLRGMARIEVDESTQTAWAQSGASALAMSQAAWDRGLSIGFGDTGSVGIGGITLGGGIGYLTRKHGMTIDNLLAAELVTADGELVVASERENTDLFWAIRGGGGNFGIATRFQYRLRAMASFTGGLMVLPATPDTIVGFMQASADAPESLGTIANVMPCPPLPFVPSDLHGKLVIFGLLGYTGPDDEAEQALAPIRALKPLADLVKPEPYPEMYPPEDDSYKPQALDYTFFMDGVDLGIAQTIMDRLNASDAALRAVQLRALGGAMARVPVDATAFAHRNAPILAVAVNFWQDDNDYAVREEWLRTTVASLDQGAPGAYVGFIREETGDRLNDVYPDQTLERLRDVKTKWDPENVFRRNLNIPPRTGSAA
jgi:FAD/FMN-containing dehydrogenase